MNLLDMLVLVVKELLLILAITIIAYFIIGIILIPFNRIRTEKKAAKMFKELISKIEKEKNEKTTKK